MICYCYNPSRELFVGQVCGNCLGVVADARDLIRGDK